jgi:hypothetical protein
VQVVGQAEQERVGRVRADAVGEQGAVDGDGPAVLRVVLRRLHDQPWLPRRRRPGARLAAQRPDEPRQPGGAGIGPGQTAHFVIALHPGNYIVWGDDPSVAQTPVDLTVSGDPATAVAEDGTLCGVY